MKYKFTYQYNLYLLCHHIPSKILHGDLNNMNLLLQWPVQRKINMLNHWENYDILKD